MKEKSWDEVLARYLRLADMDSLRMIADDFALQGDKDSLDMVCEEIEMRTKMDIEQTSRFTHELREQNRKDTKNVK